LYLIINVKIAEPLRPCRERIMTAAEPPRPRERIMTAAETLRPRERIMTAAEPSGPEKEL